MITKYYLNVEIRYSFKDILDDGEEVPCFKTKVLNSELFDDKRECIQYGNKLIESNLWIEQYPVNKGQKLNTKYGTPLTLHSLKNGAQIFISVRTLNIMDLDSMSVELQKFNLSKIVEEIK